MGNLLLGNDALSAIVAFILVLIPAVLIHELGHFFAAKSAGITVLEFGIGMPPRMVKLFTLGGTDYTLNWLPLGGFVRPLGEDVVRQLGDEAVQEDRAEALKRGVTRTKSVNEATPLQRIWFLAAGPIANFVLAFVLFVIIALMGIPQTVGGVVSLDYVQPGSTFAQAGLKAGDVIETINGKNFVDTADFYKQLQADNGQQVTLGVARANPQDAQNPLMITVTLTPNMTAAQATAESHPVVLDVSDGSPAQTAGLQIGDLITQFNGQPVVDYPTLQKLTGQNLDKQVTLTVWRDGQTQTITLTPRSNPPAGQGSMGIGISTGVINTGLGIAYEEGQHSELQAQPIGTAVQYSVGRISDVVNTVVSIPGQIIHGTADPSQLRLTSPLGISQVGGVFLQESIQRNQPSIIIEFMALISLALGMTNLLPIPALDGGRILFVIIEIIRGRPIAPEREGMVHLVGLALLLSLMVVVLLNDIANPLTNLIPH
ncbi:MAG TPA: RIP metalloprotease RseP [Phototrophicaceae bacterium]|nr:RIP metalloprotease RseP [Phototrophicaceae bacterium]